MTDPHAIAAGLTKAQRDYIRTGGREGTPHGLVRGGLLRYRWGNDPSFGYEFNTTALAVRAILQQKEKP